MLLIHPKLNDRPVEDNGMVVTCPGMYSYTCLLTEYSKSIRLSTHFKQDGELTCVMSASDLSVGSQARAVPVESLKTRALAGLRG